MKKIVRLILFLIVIQLVATFSCSLYAQKIKSTDVPGDVSQTLEFQYPYVKVTGWQKDGNDYVATIKDEGSTGKVYISASGKWLCTRFPVPADELPSAIMEYVKANYPDFIVSVACLEEKDNEKTHYYLEVKPDGMGVKASVLTFSSTGNNALINRKDPADFKDPLAPAEKPAPKPIVQKDNKESQTHTSSFNTSSKNTTSSSKSTTNNTKAPSSKTTTPQSPAPKTAVSSAKPSSTSNKSAAPKTSSTAKPSEDKSKDVASKTAEPKKSEPKPEKPKKEKPEVIVKDEQGNVALKPNTIPEVVVKSLAKKVMHPEELNWFFIDSMYVAKCYYSGKKTAVYITKNGVWEKTLTVLPEESVTGPMLKHLNDYYKGFKFKDAVKEQRADKQDKTMVDFYEKANYKAKLVTTVIFDKTGKLIRTIDPDYQLGMNDKKTSVEDEALDKYYEKMNMSLDNAEANSVPDNVKAAFKLKFPRVTNVEWKEDGNMNYQAVYFSARGKEICVFNSYGEVVETMVMGKLDNLSETIQDYIKKNYKNCKVTEYYSVKKIAEKLNYYKVFILNKKTNEEDILWFNLNGRPVEM